MVPLFNFSATPITAMKLFAPFNVDPTVKNVTGLLATGKFYVTVFTTKVSSGCQLICLLSSHDFWYLYWCPNHSVLLLLIFPYFPHATLPLSVSQRRGYGPYHEVGRGSRR